MAEVVAEQSSLGVSDVKVATRPVELVGKLVLHDKDGLRRLGKESGDNTLLGILKGKVVARTSLARGLGLGLSGGVGSLKLFLDLRVRLLDESEPSCQVGKGVLANETNGGLVSTQGLPDLGLKLAEAVPFEVRSQGQVLVQIPEMSLDGTEISAQFDWKLCEILVLHVEILGPIQEDEYECRLLYQVSQWIFFMVGEMEGLEGCSRFHDRRSYR